MDVAEVTRNAITTIGLAGVNAYLVAARDGFVLVDTGKPEKRADLVAQLARAGCAPGTLKLIVLTNGDYDHAGNAAYLRETYGLPVAMHRDDAGRVERADWSLGMKPSPDKFPLLFRAVSAFLRPGPFDTFTRTSSSRTDRAWPPTAWTPPSCICRGTPEGRSAS